MARVLGIGGVSFKSKDPGTHCSRFAHILDPEATKIELWQPKPMPA